MKKIMLVIGAAAAVVLAGCIVTSVYPFYTEKDAVFNSALVGEWSKTESSEERWKFEKAGENAYRLTYVSGGKSFTMQAHLFKLR